MRYSLRTKLIGIFAIVLLLMIFVGLVGIYFSGSVRNRHKNIEGKDISAMVLLNDINRMVGNIRTNSDLHLITESVEDMKRYESEIADWQSKIEKNLNNLENIIKNGATIGKVKEFRSAWETYLRIWHEQVMPLSRAGRDEEAFTLARTRGTAGRAAIEGMSKLDELHAAIVTAATYRLELAEQDFRKSRMISLAVILAAIIFGLAFAIKQSSNIADAVNAVSNTAKLVAAGDLEQRVNVRTGDEIESMADSFNMMISNMKKMVEELRHEITEREKAEARLRHIINSSPAVIYSLKIAGENLATSYVSENISLITGYQTDEAMAPNWWVNHLHPEDRDRTVKGMKGLFLHNLLIHEYRFELKDGSYHWFHDKLVLIRDTNGTPVEGIGAWTDITKLKLAEEQIQQQLQRMTALRNIDRAISASMDLHLTLNIFLEQVTERLGVEAADVLLLDPLTQTLNYTAGRGFHTDALKHTHLRVGEGHAGHAAHERRIVSITNLSEAENSLRRSPLLASEGFVAYYAMPLIAKGHVKGVLEIFYRTPFEADHEWLDFLEALAAQAAIAIDNAGLFNDLERSNVELILAYDTTLEGWSRALDYRDKETEGHSQRVTDITLKIARAMEVSKAELVHMRRGALLHDIGKLGVPDGVLFKPGKLDDEEWEIMRKHPVLAYELLSPIAFLHPALDIPYCHHEKWDGTGYPRGLKGEQIPRAARIFAVVDVWDALSSDRPYRPAWTEETITAYIKDEAGKHFDPNVVEVFLKLLGEQKL